MFNVDCLIVDRLILAVRNVMFIELQEHGQLVWVPVTASGVCLSKGTTTEHFAYMQMLPSDFRAGSVANIVWL